MNCSIFFELIDCKYNLDEFAKQALNILNNQGSWAKLGIKFNRTLVKTSATIHIALASQAYIMSRCGFSGMSCAYIGGRHTFINFNNYTTYPTISGFRSVDDYRKYVITHEVGHLFGLNDDTCPTPGHLAPVMLQHTIGTKGCIPNHDPLPQELAKAKNSTLYAQCRK